jgi:transposase IS116/IS110/IS902 family protein
MAQNHRPVMDRQNGCGCIPRCIGRHSKTNWNIHCQNSICIARVKLLMTIPGIDYFTALTIVSEIVDIKRFSTPWKLVGYLT